ncbi:MAG TPA: flagellar basal body rod protein FlgC [Desulfovibrio sp.]|jgi:flagellar basal-body rod protein FlgC|nr:flagellar basal body rod protein FlgC [Desulfovibrio sp.]
MDFMTALDIASSGMKAQRDYMNVISMNMANAQTTRTSDGGPYRRKSVSFESSPVLSPFDSAMQNEMNRDLQGVAVRGIVNDSRPFRYVYDPGHPDSNTQGYVAYPDINVVEEMTNMVNAMRSYEANAQSIQDVKTMFNKALAIGRG